MIRVDVGDNEAEVALEFPEGSRLVHLLIGHGYHSSSTLFTIDELYSIVTKIQKELYRRARDAD